MIQQQKSGYWCFGAVVTSTCTQTRDTDEFNDRLLSKWCTAKQKAGIFVVGCVRRIKLEHQLTHLILHWRYEMKREGAKRLLTANGIPDGHECILKVGLVLQKDIDGDFSFL